MSRTNRRLLQNEMPLQSVVTLSYTIFAPLASTFPGNGKVFSDKSIRKTWRFGHRSNRRRKRRIFRQAARKIAAVQTGGVCFYSIPPVPTPR
jgi:hypothetical protein